MQKFEKNSTFCLDASRIQGKRLNLRVFKAFVVFFKYTKHLGNLLEKSTQKVAKYDPTFRRID